MALHVSATLQCRSAQKAERQVGNVLLLLLLWRRGSLQGR